MGKEHKKWWQIIGDIKTPYVYLILMILFIYPFFRPLNFPIVISQPAQDYYNTIESVPKGGVILMHIGYSIGQMGDQVSTSVSTVKLLLDRAKQDNIKIIFLSFQSDGIPSLWYILDECGYPDSGHFTGLQYGVNYVVLPFIPGGEVAMASFCKDIWATCPVDYNNTPIANIPMMQNIKSIADCNLLIQSTGSFDTELMLIRQFWGAYKLPMLTCEGAGAESQERGYYPYQIKGFLAGPNYGAQFEKLTGVPGLGVSYADVLSVLTIMTMALIVLGNISFFMEKRQKGVNEKR